ncbi:RNA-splicing factor [Coemansia sp. RSA 1646]|nr:RNA-splicing factor [Coemansia sp. RSA 1646]KAJ2211056.1 RNA-splicing factor [Coemansia sp. RSA 487]
MGSGDLNMKKSWHPQTLANQRRVAEEKRKADEETKRAAKIQKELREERQREEMDQLNASVTHKSINKLEWMYNAPSTGIPQTSEDMEEYLLGKRDALSLLKEKDSRGSEGLTRKPEERWKEGLFAFSNRDANSERDAIAKTMEDPLADIKRREQAAIQAMLNNPLNRKRLGLDGGNTENGDSTKEKKKRRKHRRHDKESRAERGDRHRDRDRHHGQKKDRKHGGKDDGRSCH